jgi:hypothetical protein
MKKLLFLFLLALTHTLFAQTIDEKAHDAYGLKYLSSFYLIVTYDDSGKPINIETNATHYMFTMFKGTEQFNQYKIENNKSVYVGTFNVKKILDGGVLSCEYISKEGFRREVLFNLDNKTSNVRIVVTLVGSNVSDIYHVYKSEVLNP